jgi:hypothetical protein
MGYKTIEGLNSCLDRNTFSLLSRYAGLKQIFNITGYNQIIKRYWRDELEKYRKDHSVESLLRSIIGMHIYGMNSADEVHGALEKNRGLRFSCECIDGPASRSQMSRDINGVDLSMVITVFNSLKQQAKKVGVYQHNGFSAIVEKLGELKDRPVISIDGSFIRLSKGWFPFLKKGFCTLTGKQEFGMRINVGHCVNADATGGLTITDADVHETNSFEQLVTQCMKACGSTKLIFVVDKGYYDHIRFQRLYDAKILFVTPRKKYSLNKSELFPLEDKEKSVDGKRIVDGFIKLSDMKNRLRWIRVYEEGKDEPFELLTDIMNLPAEVIILLYGERWPIELLFKALKQYFGLKQPIGRTLNALLFHIYSVFIAYLMLQILRYQFGRKYLEMSLLKFRRELEYSDEVIKALLSKDSSLFT